MHNLSKISLIVLLFLSVQIHLFANGELAADNGFVNLEGNSFDTVNSLSLNGEWIFFSDTLIQPENIHKALSELDYSTIMVPSKRGETKNHLFGTYYLNLKLDSIAEQLVISTWTIYSSAYVYVNNKMVGSVGVPTQSIKTAKPGFVLKTTSFLPNKNNHIVIQYANFHREKTGVVTNIVIETPASQIKQATIRLIRYGVIIGTIIFIIFNQINYFFIRRRNRTSFYLGMLAFAIALYNATMSFYSLSHLFASFNPNFFVTLKLMRFAYYMGIVFFGLYIRSLFPTIYSKKFIQITIAYILFSAILTFFFPLHIASANFNILMFYTIIFLLYGLLVGVIGKIRGIEDAGLFIFGFGIFVLAAINDVFHNLLIINTTNLFDIGILGFILTQSQILNAKLNRFINKTQDLSQHLQYVNTNLEDIVDKRTKEIEEQKAEIEEQRDFAMSQHNLISIQKKTITDSINYAKGIQRAVLPSEKILQEYVQDSFILYKPKDTVSGDFYFIKNITINNKPHLIFCVADCTGHGVPGALLSMLGVSMLNDILGQDSVSKASDILDLLREKFKQTVGSQRRNEHSSDGIHITLCLINKDNGEMQYSGAFQSLYHVRDKEVNRIKGTNCIIGNYMREKPFENHIIKLKSNDKLYLFTDGYADQMSESGKGRFMQKKLVKRLTSFEGNSCKEQKQNLIIEFEDWKGNYEQIDDILVMGIKV